MLKLARRFLPLVPLASLLMLPSLAPAQPHLPVRSAMQVAALANPGFLVEIEVTAVRP